MSDTRSLGIVPLRIEVGGFSGCFESPTSVRRPAGILVHVIRIERIGLIIADLWADGTRLSQRAVIGEHRRDASADGSLRFGEPR